MNEAEEKKKKDGKFEKELLPHAGSLYNFAFYLTHDANDSEDLVQDTFYKAYRFIEGYQDGTNAKAWLFQILKNSFVNEYRRRKNQPNSVEMDVVAQTHDSEDASTTVGSLDPRQEFFKNLMSDQVTEAVNSLPVDFRSTLLLCDVEEFSYEEISSIMAVPIGTVRSRLNRARNMLKEKLRSYAASVGIKEKR